jgi:hypothetical protein
MLFLKGIGWTILLIVLGGCMMLSAAYAVMNNWKRRHKKARIAFVVFVAFLLLFAITFFFVINKVWERVV